MSNLLKPKPLVRMWITFSGNMYPLLPEMKKICLDETCWGTYQFMDVKKYWKLFMRSQKKGSNYIEKKGKEFRIFWKNFIYHLFFGWGNLTQELSGKIQNY